MPISEFIDRALSLLKWPLAVASLLLLPGAVWALAPVLERIVADPLRVAPFAAGFLVYFILWRWMFRRYAWGSWLSTFEHEFTHALFAFLTFHRVLKLRASWHDGGVTTFRGRGNWLITIAPYFFPTVSVAVAVVVCSLPTDALLPASVLLGVTVGFHVTSTWLETNWRQTDLRKVSLPFAVALLPTANTVAYGSLLALAAGGGPALFDYLAAIWSETGDLYGW